MEETTEISDISYNRENSKSSDKGSDCASLSHFDKNIKTDKESKDNDSDSSLPNKGNEKGKDRIDRVVIENNRVRAIRNNHSTSYRSSAKRVSSARSSPISGTPRKGFEEKNTGTPRKGSEEKINGHVPNGTPRRNENRVQSGKGGIVGASRRERINYVRDSSNLSRENSTDSETNIKSNQRPLSSKSLGRATMMSKISNAEEKKLKRHMSKHRITKPVTAANNIKDKAAAIKSSINKLKSSKIVDQESTSISIESETKASANVKSESPQNVPDDKTDNHKKEVSTLLNGKAHWSKLSGAIQKDKPKVKTPKKDDTDSKMALPRDGTKSSIATLQIIGEQGTNNNNNTVSTGTRYVSEEKGMSVISNNDSWIQSAIPYLPLGLSVLFLIMNIIIPGSGTVLSGLSILCCGKTRIQTKDDQMVVALCVNVWVGVSQLFTVTFLLVGWFWSLSWGIKMVSLSLEYKRQKKRQREIDLQALALSAFGSQVHVRPVFSKV
ncbi:hypothetical protein FSP39_022352 [Pinctada imbricata]|uniref:Protein SPEC3 n=1 Tax=Pinctada imbricata TaxID=66713 RepID=A0AA88Y183_PINIB|nr:hypothetical protein FSP39_022352 [Pinctada imbricata]